jgi:hypothetical protein
MGIEIFPPALLFKDKWDEVVVLLIQLPIPERRKKELIVEWAKCVGAVLTEDMIKQVLGPKAREV